MQKNILLLTGWGATCTVWEWIIPALDKGYQIKSVSPSWLEKNTFGSLCDLDDYVDNLANSLLFPTKVIAWSMGGLVAIKLATRYPELVTGICFISSIPTFVSKENANSGIDFDWFCQFEKDFDEAPMATIKKFFVLQTRDDEFAKQTLKKIRSNINLDQYDLPECKCGLELLKVNLMDNFLKLSCDKFFIHGDVDAVVDTQTVINAAHLSDTRCFIINGAGHVPHVSHASQVCEILRNHL